ncbi:hypothetical protein GF391_00440 [Candidatus Uhrbacteria bacterium]|nr:hypothetical protein [Candidatus Uhrbacteria bacterium]
MLIIFSITNGVSAAMTSANYEINFDAITSGGTDFSSSTNFQLSDTVGEQGTGYGDSSNYMLHAGYRQTDEEPFQPTLEFILGAQNESSQTEYTALSIAGNTVTVADESPFATGSRIGVVENQGLNLIAVVGKIVSIASNVITVDKWDGQTGSISASPAGGDDYVYLMNSYSVGLGLVTQSGTAGIVMAEVSTNATNGYTLQVQAHDSLKSGVVDVIDYVADGSVTAGEEEYGASVHGLTATSTGFDFPMNTNYRDIQKSDTIAEADRVSMIYKLSVDSLTNAGNYQQSVRYLLTANF